MDSFVHLLYDCVHYITQHTGLHNIVLGHGHDGVIKWKYFALLALCAGNSPVTGEFPTQRPVTRGFDVFFDVTWMNGWVNNRDAGDLRPHRAQYDVTVMDT